MDIKENNVIYNEIARSCPALDFETGLSCGRVPMQGNLGFKQKFCSQHSHLRLINYHRFDYYFGVWSYEILGKTPLGIFTMLMREDLKEMVYKLIVAEGEAAICYQLAESPALQEKISSRVKEYFTCQWREKMSSRIACRAKFLGEDLQRGKLSFPCDWRDLKRFDRLAYLMLRNSHTLDAEEQNKSMISDALFLILAIEEIVWQERLERYFLSGLEKKVPLTAGQPGDIGHTIPLVESRAISLFLRQFLPCADFPWGEEEIYLASPEWEKIVRWLLSRPGAGEPRNCLSCPWLGRKEEEELQLASSRRKIAALAEVLEDEKDIFPERRGDFSLSNKDSRCNEVSQSNKDSRGNSSPVKAKHNSVRFSARNLYQITAENIAEEHGVEDYKSFSPAQELNLPVRRIRAEEKVYEYFKWRPCIQM